MQCKNLKTRKEHKASLEMDVVQWVGKPLVTAEARDHVLQLGPLHNAALTKKGGIPTHPPLKRKTPNAENSQMISEIQLMFQVSGFSKERLHVDFFFVLLICPHWDKFLLT